MNTTTIWMRRLLMLVLVAGMAGSAYGQRTVTLRLNTATLPDTLKTDSVIRVMGEVNVDGTNTSPYELPDGNLISWNTSGDQQSTITATNVGGDYWEATFQVPNEYTTTFKFFSHQADANAELNGWEADPNPSIGPGTEDTTLTIHFFESQDEWHGAFQDRGPYDWRPYEVKEDSIAVWFRVVMMGAEAERRNFDPASPDVIGVRGAPELGSRIDWGANNIQLTQESSNVLAPGYHIFSGVAYWPESAVGQNQEYKFVYGSDGWEEGDLQGNRSFTVPDSDTTLHWAWFGNTAPVATAPETVESLLLFTVDLSPYEEIGLFNRARGDTLWVYGSFNDWDNCPSTNPDLCLMSAVPGDPQFEIAVPHEDVPGRELTYKFFLDFADGPFRDVYDQDPPSGWEEGHDSGINRRFVFQNQELHDRGIEYYNDITPENVIPDGTTIDLHFSVDMAPAVANDANPFDPEIHEVYLQLADPVWGFLVGFPEEEDGGWPRTHPFLTDDDGDLVYEGTLTIEGPTYSAITFRYAFGIQAEGEHVEEGGSGQAHLQGRSRQYYIVPNQDGSWPSDWSMGEDEFQPSGPLPYQTNPAFGTGVEKLPGEQPVAVTLGSNYPNPFNPSTSFEYSLTGTEHVTVRVFDTLGRLVATLVDGVQSAATYRVDFDASHLASGVYIYQLKTPAQVLSRSMVLVK